MNQQQALEVLINAVRIAQKRGAFELEEAPVLAEAVKVFMPQEEAKPEGESEATPEVEA